MKKTLFTFLLLFAATAMNAQGIVKGDMDGDGEVTITDVTSAVDVILGKAPKQTISQGGDPYAVDNSFVVGTWRTSDGGTSFTLYEDGSTNFTGASTYKFRPYQGTLMFFNDEGKPFKTIVLNEVEKGRYLLAVDYRTDTYTYYYCDEAPSSSLSFASLGGSEQVSINCNGSWTASGTGDGSLTITVSENTSTDSRSATVTVTADAFTRTITVTQDGKATGNTLTAVNLGLPSGTLWANMNVGASSPEDYGYYFAWGETRTKTTYTWSPYFDTNDGGETFNNYSLNGGQTELKPEDDAAYENWGPGWRMPSKAQFSELINNYYTTTEWTTQNGVYGLKITSKMEGYKGNSIFLPAAGYHSDSSLEVAGLYGFYWSRTLGSIDPGDAYARSLAFGEDAISTDGDERYNGFTVRPVRLSN